MHRLDFDHRRPEGCSHPGLNEVLIDDDASPPKAGISTLIVVRLQHDVAAHSLEAPRPVGAFNGVLPAVSQASDADARHSTSPRPEGAAEIATTRFLTGLR